MCSSDLPAIAIETVQDGKDGEDPASESQRLRFYNTSSGTFQISFEGATTAALPFKADATVVQAALEQLTTIGSGNVTVAKVLDEHQGFDGYQLNFRGSLANQDLARLSADASGLVNDLVPIANEPPPFTSFTVELARSTTLNNTGPSDLAADLQRVLDQKLFEAGRTIGFNIPANDSPPG